MALAAAWVNASNAAHADVTMVLRLADQASLLATTVVHYSASAPPLTLVLHFPHVLAEHLSVCTPAKFSNSDEMPSCN